MIQLKSKMFYLISFIFGLCVGSFLNVLVLRLDRKEGIISGRSECPDCGHKLNWSDLIPLVSFFWLGGHCRYCKKPISWQYPVCEFLTAVLVVGFVFQYGHVVTWHSLAAFVVMLGFWTLLLFDLIYFILPDKIIFPLLGIAFVLAIIGDMDMLISSLLACLLTAGAFDILYLVSAGRWMGFGDVKLALLIGLFFGYPLVILVVFLSVWIAAVVGIGMIFAGKANMKTALPFGSFLSAVSIIAILFYDKLSFVRLFL